MSTNFGKMNFAVGFNRQSAFPLDANSYFEDYSKAVAAAKTAAEVGSSDSAYYIGQLIIVKDSAEGVGLYQISAAKDLVKFGKASSADDLASKVSALETRATSIEGKLILASETVNGFMSKEDFNKLKGIAAGAQVNVLEGIKLGNGETSTDLTIGSDKKIDLKPTLDKYVLKTKLKNVEGKELEYAREKGAFNSLYGMTVTNTIRADVKFVNFEEWIEKPLNDAEIMTKLFKDKKRGFLNFAWGVWCTAYARDNLLRRVLDLDEYVVYCDTDSCKVTQGYDKSIFEKYNQQVEAKIRRVCEERNIEFDRYAPADIKGNKHLLGVFECETGKGRNVTYDQFITQGAKKYAYSIDGQIHVTVSGVPKSGGAKCLHSLDEFRDDLVFDFEHTNKLTLAYNDDQIPVTITDYLGNDYTVTDKSGICMLPTTYKLGKALDYADLITNESTERAKFRHVK